jgi:hypothetical protein
MRCSRRIARMHSSPPQQVMVKMDLAVQGIASIQFTSEPEDRVGEPAKLSFLLHAIPTKHRGLVERCHQPSLLNSDEMPSRPSTNQMNSLLPNLSLCSTKKGGGVRQRRSSRRTLFQIGHIHRRPGLAAVEIKVFWRAGIDELVIWRHQIVLASRWLRLAHGAGPASCQRRSARLVAQEAERRCCL